MQVCPVAPKIPASAPTTARSTSASAKMMLGDLPPSSSVTGRRLRPAIAAISRPTAALPVKLTLSTPAWLTSTLPTAASPVTTLNTPAGNPACSTNFANSSVVAEACSDGFTTRQLPAASAAASLLASKVMGEFQAVIAAITP